MIAAWFAPVALWLALVAGYLVALNGRPATLPRWSGRRVAAWTVGSTLAAAALAPPLTQSPHPDAHMMQHLLLGMFAPLGLVLGAPGTLLLGSVGRSAQLALSRTLRSRPVHVLSHPVTAAVLDIGGLYVVYLTPLHRLGGDLPAVQWILLAHFLLAGCLYTWSIAGPDPAPRRPGLPTRLAVLVAAGGAHAFLAKLLYSGAASGDHAHHGDAGGDMESAAQLMYYGGDVAEILLAAALFVWWVRRRRPAPVPTG